MKHWLHRLALTTALALPASGYAAEMSAELQTLITSHPRITAQKQNVESAKASIDEAFSRWLPSLDSEASIGYEDTDRTKLEPAGSDFDLTPRSLSVTATQNLFEGFRTEGLLSSAESTLEQAEATLQSTRQQVMFEAISAYISVLRQIRLTQLSKRNIASLKNRLDLEDERVERGSGIAVDVLQAKSRLQIAKERYTAFLGGLEEAIARYTQIYGHAPELEAMTLPQMPDSAMPETLEQALSWAQASNPTIEATDATIDSLDHRKDVAKAGYYPSVDVVAFSNYDEDVSGIRGTDINNTVLLRGRWNLFAGFADKARYEQSIAQHQSAIASGTDTIRRVMEAVRLAWTNYTISRQRAELLDNAVNIAGEVYDARTRLRDVGKDTAINVLDAENELFRAQIDAAAARFNYYTAMYRLLLSTGSLKLSSIR